MNRLTTRDDYFQNFEAYVRDNWVKLKAASLPARSWVLDAGAGASKYRPCFEQCRYETQDFCQYQGTLVEYIQPIDYVCDITEIPLPDGSLDAILCTEVLEHVTDPISTVQEFARLLKPGGQLILTAPLLSSLHMEPYHYYGGFTHYWYRHWLPHCGFTLNEVIPVGGPGRTCAVYAQSFYSEWAAKEKTLSAPRRLVSKAFRALAKIPVRFILPRLLSKMDPWLSGNSVCSGYLVAATRIAER